MTECDGTSFDWAAQHVLVTGASGLLGTALMAELAVRRPAAITAPWRDTCDLLDQNAVFAMMLAARPSVVFHLAGRVAGVQGNLSFPGAAYYENAQINLNVIEGARRAGARKVIAAGTAAIYADGLAMPMREADLGFGRPHGSEAAYAAAKLGMLAHLEAYANQYEMAFAFLVCTNLYGPNDRFDERYGHVVPSLISRFHRLAGERASSAVVWGDGSPTRDFLHVADAARAFLCCAAEGGGVLNVASGVSVTIRSLVEIIAETADFQGEIVWDTSKSNGQQTRSYDITRLAALGWRPQFDLRLGIEDTYRWYARHDSVARR